MPISLVTFRLSPTRWPSMSTTTMSAALSRNLLMPVGVARMRSWLRRTERFPAVPGTKPNRYSHLPKRASCLRCKVSADRSGAVELKAMFRVVVNPVFSRAVGCIRHQFPDSALSRSFRRIDGKRNRENTDNDEFRPRSISLVWEDRVERTVTAAFVKKLALGYFRYTNQM